MKVHKAIGVGDTLTIDIELAPLGSGGRGVYEHEGIEVADAIYESCPWPTVEAMAMRLIGRLDEDPEWRWRLRRHMGIEPTPEEMAAAH